MRVAVIGATGYSGIELLRILTQHPEVSLEYLTSDSYVGKKASEVYPHLKRVVDEVLRPVDPDAIAAAAELTFIGLPAGLSTALVPELLARGCKVIDIGGDYRLPGELYKQWYGKEPGPADVQGQAVYGLPETSRDRIRGANWITNPGCFPTAANLALLPLLAHRLIDPKSIIIDAKSGVSGAGRGANLGTHFSEVNENFKAYKVGTHQHTPEIEQCLSQVAGELVTVTFTPHLAPMTRGILATVYASLTQMGAGATEALLALYDDFYRKHPFVRVRPIGNLPMTKEVAGSNYCDIGLQVDTRTGRVVVVSVIDNVVKGAAGQAIQNMNLMSGFPETMGLTLSPLYP